MDEFEKIIYVEKKGKKSDDECKSRYIDENGRFKVMTDPEDPSKKSRFAGCCRYFMNCRGLSLDQAKRMCGYIARYVKKGGEIDGRLVDTMVELMKAEEAVRPIRERKRLRESEGGRVRELVAMELYGKEYDELSDEEKDKICRIVRIVRERE